MNSLPLAVDPILCTGEHADSLADVDIYPIAPMLVEEVARHGRGTLELRTKSDAVDALLDLEHQNRTIVAFSVAPEDFIARYEGGTASLQARLEAAHRCQASGYAIALKLEPFHLSSGWQRSYNQLIEDAATVLDLDRIAHVSVGCLRASPALLEVPAFARRHAAALAGGEMVHYRAGAVNIRPPRVDRLAAYRSVKRMLRSAGIEAPVWWSMETPAVLEALGRRQGRSEDTNALKRRRVA